jgi:hypothetical protein
MRTRRGKKDRVQGETRYDGDVLDILLYRGIYIMSERAAGRTPVLAMTTSASTLPSSDQRRPAKETIDVSILREIARNSLVHALNSVSLFPFPFCVALSFTISKVNGAKTLVLDPSLAGPLSLVTEVSLLQVYIGHPYLF